LLDAAPESTYLRYLSPEPWHAADERIVEDEVGYLFLPGVYGYDFQDYLHLFSGKTWKKIAKEMERVSAPGLSFRYDHLQDLTKMFQMNLETFGSTSYFSDARFLGSFETMISRLHENEMLRITTVLIGGKIAAIDVGALWENTYTVLAGSTSPEFRGVAKLINFHHLEWACGERIDSVDFLCGDFGWKERFHLTPRPLYEIMLSGSQAGESNAGDKARAYA
jgi:CelD/BcsL family acetyltransferase involved in cellulose biosynthesis